MRHQVAAMLVMIALGNLALPTVAAEPAAGGLAVVASEPGKAALAEAVEITATVTALDKGSRLVTLKGPKGNFMHVVAGDEVKNFAQIKVGDMLVVRYIRALELELKKGSGLRQRSERDVAMQAKPGDKPAAGAAREVKIVADVIAVDPAKQVVTLKGPKGRIVDLEVRNPEHFNLVQKGDQVEAVYTEALALSIQPAKH